MADEPTQGKPARATEEKAQRSLTGSGALDLVMHLADGAAVGAGGAIGVHVVNSVVNRPKDPPPPKPDIVLPPGVDKE